MEDHSKHIDHLFREGLGDYQETPPASLWTSLEQRLPAAEPPAAESRSKRWLWILLLIALMGTISYFIIQKTSETSTKEREDINQSTQGNTPSGPTPSATAPGEGDTGVNTEESDSAEGEVTGSDSPADKSESTSGTTSGERNVAGTDAPSSNKTGKTGQAKNVRKSDRSVSSPDGATSAQTAKPPIATNKKIPSKATTNNTDNSTGPAAKASNTQSGPVNAAPKTAGNGVEKENNIGNNEKSAPTAANIATKPQVGTGNKENNNSSPETALTSKKAANNQATGAKPNDGVNTKGNVATTTPGSATPKEGNNPKTTTPANNNTTKATDKPNTAVKAAAQKQNTPTPDESTKSATNTATNNNTATPAATKPLPEPEKPKPVTVTPEPGAGKPVVVTNEKSGSATPVDAPANKSQGKPIEVNAAPNEEKSVARKELKNNNATPETAAKARTSNIKTNDNQALPEPKTVVKPKNEYKMTPEGIALNTDQEEEEEEVEQPKSDNAAASVTPGPQGGGGAGGIEPFVPLRNFNKPKIEGGVKIGYDRGFAEITTSNFVFAPYVQWNASKRISAAIQPAIRYNQVNKTVLLDDPLAYHRITSALRDSNHIVRFGDSTQGAPDTIIRVFRYRNSYDSILVNYSISDKNYWEVELPLLLKYNIAPNLAIFGGLSMTFGNIIQIGSNSQTFNNLQRLDSIMYGPVVLDSGASYPNPPPPAMINFEYNTPNFGTANIGNNQNPASSPARFGYMLGLSYELRRRLLIDLMVRQNLSDMRYIPNEQVRKIYTQPYVRLMIGYKLFGGNKDTPVNPNGL